MNSTKSIIDKLNFKKYINRLIINKPDYVDDFESIEYDVSIKKNQYELIFIFIYNLEDFSKHIQMIVERNLINDKGYVFFAYPKKNNQKYTEFIERDEIYSPKYINEEKYVLNSELKFSRMVSLDDVFTVIGLKQTPKKAKKTTTSKKSQCVDDYIIHIEDIRNYLKKNEEILHTYDELTFGYQKDWARYVFSAKRIETQEKRLVEMEIVLREGFKTMDLYRRSKK